MKKDCSKKRYTYHEKDCSEEGTGRKNRYIMKTGLSKTGLSKERISKP